MSEAAEQAQGGAETTSEEEVSLLDKIVTATKPRDDEAKDRAKDFITEFIKQAVTPGQVVSKDTEATINYWIKEVDNKLSAQLNEIMHHNDFQKLEGSWRGLHYLVHQSETGDSLKIRVLNVKKKELLKDLKKAAEFDQSQLFKKVYEDGFGIYGGESFGLLVGDYEFNHQAGDVELMQKSSGVAAAAHAPFVAAADPTIFNMDRYTELANPRDLAKIFQSVEYASWKSGWNRPV